MLDSVTLSCPSCGAKLKITADIDRFACAYCGTEQIVRRQSGIVSLAPVITELQRIRSSSDATARELAVARLRNEISDMQAEITQLATKVDREDPTRFALACTRIGKGGWLKYLGSSKDIEQHRVYVEVVEGLSGYDMDRFISGYRDGVLFWTKRGNERDADLRRIRNMKVEIDEKKAEMRSLLNYER